MRCSVLLLWTACGRLGFDAGANGDAADGAATTDTTAVSSCIASPRASLIYSTPTFADFVDGWFPAGGGTWGVTGGRLVQSDGANTVDLAYATHPIGTGDYRIAAGLHASTAQSTYALELAARVSSVAEDMIHCNWRPADGIISINLTIGAVSQAVITTATVDLATVPDPLNVVMELQAVGPQLACCLAGVPLATIRIDDATLTTGDVGVKTFDMAGAFDQFAVYQ